MIIIFTLFVPPIVVGRDSPLLWIHKSSREELHMYTCTHTIHFCTVIECTDNVDLISIIINLSGDPLKLPPGRSINDLFVPPVWVLGLISRLHFHRQWLPWILEILWPVVVRGNDYYNDTCTAWWMLVRCTSIIAATIIIKLKPTAWVDQSATHFH